MVTISQKIRLVLVMSSMPLPMRSPFSYLPTSA
jgi:hypothetical protein